MTETMQKLVEAIENRLYGTGITVEPQEVKKNNSTKIMAILVGGTGDMLQKLVYVDEVLDKMDAGEIDEEEAAEEFEERYRQTESQERPECVTELSEIIKSWDVEKMMQNVRPMLVNEEWNKETDRIAGGNLLDMMIQYEIRVGEASVAVTENMFAKMGIELEELKKRAAENAKTKGFMTIPIQQLTGNMFDEDEFPMYVITNPEGNKGAAVMLYCDYFEKLADKLGADIYIIPSSVHEVIAIPVQGDAKTVLELATMIKEVNDKEVLETERLSDHPYIYKRGSMQVAIA